MGRTLPWNPVGHPSMTKPPTILHPTATASPPPGTPLSRPKPAAPLARPTLVSGPVPPPSPAHSPAHSRTDGSSSSPASSPFRPPEGPLPESFMTQGFDKDDRWRMVEDEFYSVAARFTAHLHAAQYRRLKDEAKRQIPTIHTPSRPVTRPPTLDVVRRQGASTSAASQRRAFATAKLHSKASGPARTAARHGDSDRFQIQPPTKRTRLASLLESPRKIAQPLASIAASSTEKHAAALTTTTTPSARPTPLAARHKISMSASETLHDRHVPSRIRRQAAVGAAGLTAQPARSQSHHDSQVGMHSAVSRGATQAARLTAPTSMGPVAGRGISARGVALQKPVSTDYTPLATTPHSAEASDGSGSGSETYFQRRLKARCSKPKSQRAHRHPALDESSGKEQVQLEPKREDTSNAALSVPSI